MAADLCLAPLSQLANVFTKHTALSLPIPWCNEATARARPPASLLQHPHSLFFSLLILTRSEAEICANELTDQL